MLFLCSIYALRASEVTNLTLDDFDWFNETLTVRRAKQGRIQQFPLQFEIGEAIISYLRQGRPFCKCRNLFVTARAPYHQLSPQSLRNVIAQHMISMGITAQRLGPHSLRHACATQLLRRGSSLRDIADFLGHKDMSSVCIYAKHDIRTLKNVAVFSLAGVR
jgi:site-specific recombinase XerD